MPYSVLAVTFTTGATYTSHIDLGNCPHQLAIGLSTFDAGFAATAVSVNISTPDTSVTGTYRNLTYVDTSAACGTVPWSPGVSGDDQVVVCEPAQYVRYVRLETSTAATTTYEAYAYIYHQE